MELINIQNSIHAIIVTYYPNCDNLNRLLAVLDPQVQKIWLIDNASATPIADLVRFSGLINKPIVLQNSNNIGLAAAQNRGIISASMSGATHILMLDQDSIPMHDMVWHLVKEISSLQLAGFSVAGVGPSYVSSITMYPSRFVRLDRFSLKKALILPGQTSVEVDILISSGTLIRTSVFQDIGLMDESLFIDHVDTEWCLRARSKGYKFFGLPKARMIHSLGEKQKRIWCLRWRNVSYHHPFRYYYIIRNVLLLQRRCYIPLNWKFVELVRSINILLYHCFFGFNRKQCISYMRRGIFDGLRGVSGAIKV